ncbi:MAG: 2-amino-4-hydroxy-6-hydroxymethyldihydropteridine diphosphokinase [Alphaproteobacteria bacterium]|nr:2-amino-4-hydroxy-6-hydroxymethyldihydropteridine diphosphokinase [Alphaproteobacteria bacterium]
MILIGLGANLPSPAGPPAATINAALSTLGKRGIEIAALSRLYGSLAWPNPADPPFVNAVAWIRTGLAPESLLVELHSIEQACGRLPGARNAPRPLDLDILDYDGRVEPGPPRLPHPRMQDRAFVLVPLAEIAPNWRHPLSDRSAAELVANLPDHGCGVYRL